MMLAAILGQPAAIASAISELNRFVRQVLELACVQGGAVNVKGAAAEGLEEAPLRQAAHDLARWGLAFQEAGGIVVPAEVRAQLRNPGGLRPPVAALAGTLTVEELRLVIAAHGIKAAAQPKRKPELIDLLGRLLSRPGLVRAVVEAAPPPMRDALRDLRAAGGRSSAFAGKDGRGWYYGARQWRWDARARETPEGWLASRGLVLPAERDYGVFEVPAEVELALRGRLFADWQPEPPPLRAQALKEDRHPLEVVSAVGVVLEAWREGVPALVAGGPPQRELKRLARTLQVDEDRVSSIVSQAFQARLLREREVVPEKMSRSRVKPRVVQTRRAVIEPTEEAAQWQGLPEAARWLSLYRPWVQAQQRWLDASAPGAWTTFLEVLQELPEGSGAAPAEIVNRLAWRRPAVFDDDPGVCRWVEGVTVALHELGAAGAPPPVGLTAVGRLAQRTDLELSQLEAMFPPSVSDCTITADRRVVVTGVPDPALGSLLSRAAEVVSVHPARVYRLSEASLARALNSGLAADEILGTLASRAKRGVPPNVASLVHDVARRHGRLRVGTAGVYVVAGDPSDLVPLTRGRLGRSLKSRLIAPTVAVLDLATPADAIALLRKEGLLPRLDGESDDAPQPPPRPAPAPSPRHPSSPAEKSRAATAIAALASALRAAPGDDMGMPASEVARIAALAASRQSVVEMIVQRAGSPQLLRFQARFLQGRRLIGVDEQSSFSYARHEVDLLEVPWLRIVAATPGAVAFPGLGARGLPHYDDWEEDDGEDWEAEEGEDWVDDARVLPLGLPGMDRVDSD